MRFPGSGDPSWLVTIKVALVRISPNLDKFLPVRGNPQQSLNSLSSAWAFIFYQIIPKANLMASQFTYPGSFSIVSQKIRKFPISYQSCFNHEKRKSLYYLEKTLPMKNEKLLMIFPLRFQLGFVEVLEGGM